MPTPILAKPEQHSVVEQLQETAAEATTPLQLWERTLEHPVALFVLPLFALVNAGIAIEPAALPALLSDSLALGIGLGLLGGMGFTMSLFIAGLGFASQPEQLVIAKSGILTASLNAGAGVYLWLRFACKPPLNH